MCGICGIYNLEGDRPIDREILGRMLQKIRTGDRTGARCWCLNRRRLDLTV